MDRAEYEPHPGDQFAAEPALTLPVVPRHAPRVDPAWAGQDAQALAEAFDSALAKANKMRSKGKREQADLYVELMAISLGILGLPVDEEHPLPAAAEADH